MNPVASSTGSTQPMIVMEVGIGSVVGIAGSSAIVVPGGTWREGRSGGVARWWRGGATVMAPQAGGEVGDWDGVVVVVIPGLDVGGASPEIEFRLGFENSSRSAFPEPLIVEDPRRVADHAAGLAKPAPLLLGFDASALPAVGRGAVCVMGGKFFLLGSAGPRPPRVGASDPAAFAERLHDDVRLVAAG